jgi:hypothetical protein
MPALVASVHAACPTATPKAVKIPLRRPPSSVFRIVNAVSGPGVTITRRATPRNAQSRGSMSVLWQSAERTGYRLTVDVGLRGCRIVRSGSKVGLALTGLRLFAPLATLLAHPSAVHLGAPFDTRTFHLAARRSHTSGGQLG